MPKKKSTDINDVIKIANDIKEKEESIAPDQKTIEELTAKVESTVKDITKLRRRLGLLTSVASTTNAPAGKTPQRPKNVQQQIDKFFETKPEGGTLELVVESMNKNKAAMGGAEVQASTVQTKLKAMEKDGKLKMDGAKFIPVNNK